MDPMYLNIHQAAVASANVSNSAASVSAAPPSQINGLPQESKLASYISVSFN